MAASTGGMRDAGCGMRREYEGSARSTGDLHNPRSDRIRKRPSSPALLSTLITTNKLLPGPWPIPRACRMRPEPGRRHTIIFYPNRKWT